MICNWLRATRKGSLFKDLEMDKLKVGYYQAPDCLSILHIKEISHFTGDVMYRWSTWREDKDYTDFPISTMEEEIKENGYIYLSCYDTKLWKAMHD